MVQIMSLVMYVRVMNRVGYDNPDLQGDQPTIEKSAGCEDDATGQGAM